MVHNRFSCAWDEAVFGDGPRFSGERQVGTALWRLNPTPAATYEAFDRARGEHVWIRSYPNGASVVEYEYETLRRLRLSASCRHVLGVHDLFLGPSYVAFSAERLDGTSLRAHLGRPERDYPRLRSLLGQLVRALDVIHQSGSFHGDVRPENVFVRPNQEVVLAGFAPFEWPQSIDSVFYEEIMSYETSDRGPADDFYSIGALLFEALTGRRTFEGTDVLRRFFTGDPLPTIDISGIPPGAPDDLRRLCGALLAADPAERPSALEILGELDH